MNIEVQVRVSLTMKALIYKNFQNSFHSSVLIKLSNLSEVSPTQAISQNPDRRINQLNMLPFSHGFKVYFN